MKKFRWMYGKTKRFPIGVEWGGPNLRWYYFYWWNWLPVKNRYFGLHRLWYDGPHVSFGLWWINISWCTKWSKPPKEFRKKDD